MTVKEIEAAVSTSALIERPASQWRAILSEECGAYVCGRSYLCKPFDSINYEFCDEDSAKQIIKDNLYALLRFKYFPKVSEESDKKITEVVQSFLLNIKTTLKRVSFNVGTDAREIKMIPDGCIAFRNGVFNFKENNWLFKYDIIKMENLNNSVYLYSNEYAIFWYMDYDFTPLPINIRETSLDDFINIMKGLTQSRRNYCYELMHNISHNANNSYSKEKFIQLCEVIAYTLLNSFSQHFVILIGSGQNGKNSLFDGCFTSKVVPTPAANTLDAIEKDKFISGSLVNKSHNIYLEASTTDKVYEESQNLKNLTGSMYQTIEEKGINKYSGIINCKYMWAANDQDKLKFGDTSEGFRRRVNMLEIWYKYDSDKTFLTRGDYYDTTFSEDLSEIKNDIINSITFIYFGMYGLMSATGNFTRNFKFTYNDWRLKYLDIDFDLKEKVEMISPEKLLRFMISSEKNIEECKTLLFDTNKQRLYMSYQIKELGYNGYEGLLNLLRNEEDVSAFFNENDFYINLKLLQNMMGDIGSTSSFTQRIKKLYNIKETEPLYNNRPYVKARFVGNSLRILTK